MDSAERLGTVRLVSGEPSVTIEHFTRDDLRGAMLFRAFARSAPRAIFLRPGRSILLAVLTAGLFPTGLLLSRLWMIASFHRFRVAELSRWLGLLAADAPLEAAPPIRRIRPTGILLLAWSFWFAGLITGVAAAGAAGYRSRLITIAVAAVAAAGFMQVLAVATLRLRVAQFFGLPEVRRSLGKIGAVDPSLPGWTLWPMALLPAVAFPFLLLHWRLVALWTIAAVSSLLAAEVQRGYITVADRRLRYAVARAIGRRTRAGAPQP